MTALLGDLPSLALIGRDDRVRRRIDGRAEGLLVSSLDNVRWLSGFSGSSGWVIVLPDRLVLVTDGRYGDQARRQMADAGVDGEVVVGLSGAETEAHIAATVAGLSALGFEAEHTSYAEHTRRAAVLAPELVPLSGIVEAERRTKDEAEIARMATACAIADRALADVAPSLGDGLTEAEVRNALEIRMRELGASGPSYDTIVAAGPTHAALPHHRPTERRIEDGDLVIIDVGALVEGYHSDMTRSFVVGTPTAEQLERYEVIRHAQAAGVAAVRAGLEARDLDAVCRSAIADAGYGEWFIHGTGHGVGLLIHEDPFAGRTSTATLQEGDVVTVEPGLYRDGFGGIRIEDLVVVTSDGCRVLTSSPKGSPCLPSPPTT